MTSLHDIAPRIARARDAEIAYRQRRDHQRMHGYMSLDVATEEMVRSMRKMRKSYGKMRKSYGKMARVVHRMLDRNDS